ncbi:MAG: CPBP family intramembrane metalloprotease [Candidatus Wallbacteria bacterium]|nr:CPBP family intramembrane metalloprotease [Candidatus Wallbacteria bacterium]
MQDQKPEPGFSELFLLVLGYALLVYCEHCTKKILIQFGYLNPTPDFSLFDMLRSFLNDFIFFAMLFYFACFRSARSFREAFSFRKVSASDALAALLSGFLTAVFCIYLMSFVEVEETFIDRVTSGFYGMLFFTLNGSLIAPFLEELFFRGFLFGILRNKLKPVSTVAVVAFTFWLMHFYQTSGNPPALAMLAALSLIVTVQRQISGSLIPSLITHYSYNIFLIGTTLILMWMN